MFTVLILDGHAPAEGAFVRLAPQIELFDRIEGASGELRQIVAQRCPHQLHKLAHVPAEHALGLDPSVDAGSPTSRACSDSEGAEHACSSAGTQPELSRPTSAH